MELHIDGFETPDQLRTLATFIRNWADLTDPPATLADQADLDYLESEPESQVTKEPEPESEPQVTEDTPPQLDSAGLPWDERINSGGNNRQNKDGTWKRRRGVSVEEYTRVRKELATGGTDEDDLASKFEQPSDLTWPDFVNKCVVARANGQYDDIKAAEFLASHNVENFNNLINRSDLWVPLLKDQGISDD